MTHDELLAKIDYTVAIYEGLSVLDIRVLTAYLKALRAVVEIHEPETIESGSESVTICSNCNPQWFWELPYPCPTIQAIKKELL